MAPTSKQLLERNAEYAETHEPMPLISDIQAAGTPPPKTVIVTCVDPRVFPEEILKLKVGEAFIFRTIAGHPQPVFENIVGLDRTSHGFEDIILLYHTAQDCGAMYFDEKMIRSGLLETDPSAKDRIEAWDIGTIKSSVEECLRADMAWMKSQSTLREGLKSCVKGFMYDIKTGKLREVE